MMRLEWPNNSGSQNGKAIRDLTGLDQSLSDLISANGCGGLYLRIPVVEPSGTCVDYVRIEVVPDVVRDLFRTALADCSHDMVMWMTPRDDGSTELELMDGVDVE